MVKLSVICWWIAAVWYRDWYRGCVVVAVWAERRRAMIALQW